MQRHIFPLMAILLVALPSYAIVIRHDVSDDNYLVKETLPAMFDMRHQGHGMLIAPEWVVTAAHLIFYDYKNKTITLSGTEHEIEYVIFHPGYSKPPKDIFSGYSGPSQAYLRSNHDIALVKLKEPIRDVSPIALYRESYEEGSHITFYGKGNTGDGHSGQIAKTGGILRRAENIITDATDQWLTYRFDSGETALPNEGIQGDGDSGGPALISKGDSVYLAGLVSWDLYDGDIAAFKGGLYNMEGALVRISHYINWIEEVQNWPEDMLHANHYKIQS